MANNWQDEFRVYQFTIPTDVDLKKAWQGVFSKYQPGETITVKSGSPEYNMLINGNGLREVSTIPAKNFSTINDIERNGAGYRDLQVLPGSTGEYVVIYNDPSDGSRHTSELNAFLQSRNITLQNNPTPTAPYKAGQSPQAQALNPAQEVSQVMGASAGGSTNTTGKMSFEEIAKAAQAKTNGTTTTKVGELDVNPYQPMTPIGSTNSYVYSGAQLGSKANDAAVNQLYQSYFGRDASKAELANWGTKGNSTVKALEDFLKQERVDAIKRGVTNLPPVKPLPGTKELPGFVSPGSSQTSIPAGATQIMTPAELSQYTESQIWRDPNSNKIYRLQPSTNTPNNKMFYKDGKDLIDASTGLRITETDWKNNWNGKAIEVQSPKSPTQNPYTGVDEYKQTTSDPNINPIVTNPIPVNTTPTTPTIPTTPTTPTPTTTTPTNNSFIPFRPGLNQSQQDSITALSQKPIDQWTQTDRDNWNWATNGAPMPGSNAPKTDTTTPKPGDTTTPKTDEVSADDKKWINDLYQKYFDRNATSAEIANWATGSPDALDQFLAKEQKTYGYVSKAQGIEKKARYDAAMAIIDASDLPPDIKALWKQTVGMYPDATDFNATEIINAFNKIKTDTIDPYYKELTDVAIKDVQTQVDNLNFNRQAELEAERKNAGDLTRQVQSGLEKSGMTFTGKGVEELGAGSAYAQGGNVATPTQIGFAGMPGVFYEGNVNQNNRLISTSTAARYAQNQQAIGSKAEGVLGSAALSGVKGLTYTPGGVNLTGSNALAKETQSASALTNLINQWRNKQTIKTNL